MERGSFIIAQLSVYVQEQAIRVEKGGLKGVDKEIKYAFLNVMEIKPVNCCSTHPTEG